MQACRFTNTRVCNLACGFGLRRGPSSAAAASAAFRLRRGNYLGSNVHAAAILPFFSSKNSAGSRSSSTVTKAFFKGCEKAPSDAPAGKKLATFAGGCFWGLELAFQRVAGVEETAVGYTQGKLDKPSYQLVCTGLTGHTEGVQVVYDPQEVTFEELLDVFFDKTDPTTKNRQGFDQGTQYRSGIYFHDPDQEAAASKAIADVQKQLDEGTFRAVAEKNVVVELLPAKDFFIAEEYHQQYLEKGGRNNMPQSAEKGCKDTIRCYG